jgi:N-acetylmuramoyl-L-alanine amidase
VRGDDVAELQRRLNTLGFDAGREDGILGPETEAALRQFQRNAGLAADGVCGPATIRALERLDALAAGSVASLREREALRSDARLLQQRNLYVVSEPRLADLAAAVERELGAAGALVTLTVATDDPGLAAAHANQCGADLCLAVGAGADPGVRCAYFATERYRSEAGYAIATSVTAALSKLLPDVQPPVGRTYRLLRETRMAAVLCELYARDDDVQATVLTGRSPELARALVDGVRTAVEAPAQGPSRP